MKLQFKTTKVWSKTKVKT